MTAANTPDAPSTRLLAAAGALLAAASVALSAYAAHATDGEARATLQTAAVFAFGHGVALAALARGALRGLARLALLAILIGTLLFCGALVLAHVAGVHARTAPFGGGLLILAWLAYAIDALRAGSRQPD